MLLLQIALIVVAFIWVLGSVVFGVVYYSDKTPPSKPPTKKDKWLDLLAVVFWPVFILYGLTEGWFRWLWTRVKKV
jgi:hypothetical protein